MEETRIRKVLAHSLARAGAGAAADVLLPTTTIRLRTIVRSVTGLTEHDRTHRETEPRQGYSCKSIEASGTRIIDTSNRRERWGYRWQCLGFHHSGTDGRTAPMDFRAPLVVVMLRFVGSRWFGVEKGMSRIRA